MRRARVGDDRLGIVEGQCRQRGPDLGHHAARDHAARDEVFGFRRGQRIELLAVLVPDAVDVGHQHQLPSAKPRGDAGRRVIRVDVADDAVLVSCEWRHDRHLAADEDRVEQVASQPDDVRHEPEVRHALGDQEAAVDAREPDRIDAEVAQPGHELTVDDAPQDGRRDFQGGRIRDAEPALESTGHAEPLEPVGDPLAAAMDEHDGPLPRERGHFLEDLPLIGDGRPAELDDDDFAHVTRLRAPSGGVSGVLAVFPTYSSVRSQPKASPVPLPRPRSIRTIVSGASMSVRTAALSNGCGPPSAPSNTSVPGDRDLDPIGIDRRGLSAAGAGFGGRQPGRLEDRRLRQPGVPGGAGDPAPVRVATVDGGLEQAARDDGPGDGTRFRVVDSTADLARQQCRCALAVGGLLAGKVSRRRLRSPRPAPPPASEPATTGAVPAAPEASTKTVSFVLVSPSTVSWSQVRAAAGRSSPCRAAGSIVASVITIASIVAIRGWIIPTPLAIPLTWTVAVPPPARGKAICVPAIFVRESVVRSPTAAASRLAGSVPRPLSISAAIPAVTLSTGRRVPMRPVESVRIRSGWLPRAVASAAATSAWSAIPAAPVAALAQPLVEMTAIGPAESAGARGLRGGQVLLAQAHRRRGEGVGREDGRRSDRTRRRRDDARDPAGRTP